MNNKNKNTRTSDSFYSEGGSVGFLLVHGLGGSPMTLRFLAQGLARQGYTVSCPFVPGLAGGSDLEGLSTWQDWYGTVEKAYLELKSNCDRVIVGGLSTGAVLSLRLAQQYGDEIEALSLYAPTLWPNGSGIPKYFKLTALIRQKWFANLFMMSKSLPYGIKDDRIRKFWFDMMESQSVSLADAIGIRGGKLIELRWLGREVRKGLAKIQNKTLFMHSREDDMSDISNSFELMRSIKGPTEMVVLDDSYHMVTLDRQREHVVNRTAEFVDGILAAQDQVASSRNQGASKATPVQSDEILRSSGAAE
ncbi:MAG: alpha/beta hydrolase [Hyphomicrobiaceae bacterium]